jgi:two-component system cell cycle sensor histidine kinase/response regulator CckA
MTGRLLMVEDEEGIRVAIARMLRKIGLSVMEASDGWAAIDLIRNSQEAIDVILLDVTIPGASSPEVFTAVQRFRPEIKVILTTAHDREAATNSFHAPQLKGYIRKPYQFADLVQLLADSLAGAG